jgi:hypothetical protein
LKEVLAGAIHFVVFLKKHSGQRRVTEIAAIGYSPDTKDYTFDFKYLYDPAADSAAILAPDSYGEPGALPAAA